MSSEEVLLNILDSIKEGTKEFDERYWIEKDKKAEFPSEFFERIKELGLTSLLAPEEFGGVNMSITNYVKIVRYISSLHGVFAGDLLMALNAFVGYPISKFGNEKLKNEILPKLVKGEIIPSIGITEPLAGVDTLSIQTKAICNDNECNIIGQKTWITLAHLSNYLLLLARTSPPLNNKKSYGLTLFIINPKEHSDNIIIHRIDDIALRPLGSCQVYLNNVTVRKDYILGEINNGWEILKKILNIERLSTASIAIGTAELVLNKTIEYASVKKTFGKPIGSNQAIQFPLAEGKILLEAAWKMVLEGAKRLDNGEEDIGFEANAGAYLAANAAYKIADAAMQTFGGMAFAVDTGIEMHWRNLRLFRVGPVPEQMILSYVAHNILKLPRSF